MLCNNCIKKHDYSIEAPDLANKILAVSQLLISHNERYCLSEDAIHGVGLVLRDLWTEFEGMKNALYEDEQEEETTERKA